MSESTRYIVEAVYDVRDKGGVATSEKLISSAARAERSILSLKGVVAGLGVGMATRAAYGALVGYNAKLEASVTSLATTMYGFGREKSYDRAIERATDLVDNYREVAKKSVGETSDFVNMHQSVQGVLLQTGMTMKDVTDITIGATVASQLLGENAEMTALDIKQMAMGTMTARDRVGGMLVGMLGSQMGKTMGYADWNKMVKQRPAEMRQMLLNAVNNDAMKKAADRMATTFNGRLSTFKDNVNLFFSKMGKGIFDAFSSKLGDVNAWFDKNGAKMDQWAKSLGESLVSAFQAVRSGVGFLVDNASTILHLALAWKAATLGMGAIGALSGKGPGIRSRISGAADSLAAAGPGRFALGAAAGAASLGFTTYELTRAVMEFTGATKGIANWLGDTFPTRAHLAEKALSSWDAELRKSTAAVKSFGDAVGRNGQNGTLNAMMDARGGLSLTYQKQKAFLEQALAQGNTTGVFAAHFKKQAAAMGIDTFAYGKQVSNDNVREAIASLDRHIANLGGKGLAEFNSQAGQGLIRSVIGAYSKADQERINQNPTIAMRAWDQAFAATGGKLTMAFGAGVGEAMKILSAELAKQLAGDAAAMSGVPGEQAKPPKQVTNVNINRIEMASKDPNRWLADIDAIAARHTRAPRQPRKAIRGGQ